MTLELLACPYRDLDEARRAAAIRLMVPRYRALSYPTTGALADALGAPPGSPTFAAKLADLDERIGAALGTFAENHAVSGLFARTPRGAVVALAIMRTIRGTRAATLAATIGAPDSSLPTHRVLRDFAYPPCDSLDPAATPERALAEWGRLVVANYDQLRPLVADGTLSPGAATFVVRRGFDAMIAASYRRDRRLPDPPRAYIFNAKPRLARVMRDGQGLSIVPLFAAGAEPTAIVLDRGTFDAPYFQRWTTALRPLVPPAILQRGQAAALRYLVAADFRDWHTLPINLPYLTLCDERTARAIERLAGRALRTPILAVAAEVA